MRRSAFAAAIAAAVTAPALAQPSGTITLMAYSGIFQENYTAAVIEPFKQRFPGVEVTYFGPGTSAQMLGILRSQRSSPQTDVVIMDTTTAAIAWRAESPASETGGGACGPPGKLQYARFRPPLVTWSTFVILGAAQSGWARSVLKADE